MYCSKCRMHNNTCTFGHLAPSLIPLAAAVKVSLVILLPMPSKETDNKHTCMHLWFTCGLGHCPHRHCTASLNPLLNATIPQHDASRDLTNMNPCAWLVAALHAFHGSTISQIPQTNPVQCGRRAPREVLTHWGTPSAVLVFSSLLACFMCTFCPTTHTHRITC